MRLPRSLLRWLLGKPAVRKDPLEIALRAFRTPTDDSLPLLRQLVAALRPGHGEAPEASIARHARLLERLAGDPALRNDFRRHIAHFLADRRLVTFFTDSGILPGTGFFSEWWRILGEKFLPEVPNEYRLKDCLHLIFDHGDDWRWLAAIPREQSQELWQLLAPEDESQQIDWLTIEQQLLDAIQLLAHRIGGLGVDEELMRAAPDFDDHTPRFIALSAEAQAYATTCRAALGTGHPSLDDGSQLLVIADQCRETLSRIRKRAQSKGTSIHLSFLLTRSEQNLARLHDLVALLQAPRTDSVPATWIEFASTTLIEENRRNSLRHYLRRLSQLLAVRVTENAARSGEHYICEQDSDYRHLWRSAAGAGVLIAAMALLKIQAAGLHAPLAIEAMLFSLIYGLGFVLIYLLGMTVATKQPAMTAQTLASLLGDLRPTRQADIERLVDVAAAVSRSQLAAIAGNVMVALPMAMLIAWAWQYGFGEPPLSQAKGGQLLGELDLFSWALPHAAIAGFYLFLSGLITGYFDNHAVYAGIGGRVARLPWLRRLLGEARAETVGGYLEARLGGIMGNFLFGCMLGSTGFIGTLLGLPLDIRHIAFSSANLGYALSAHDFSLPWQALAWATLGIILIGATNLAVSFILALRTAMRARGIAIGHWGPLLGALLRRLRQQPRSFLMPVRASTN